jgi:hypothetical protein
MAQKGQGTIAHRDAWDIFDQIMLSNFNSFTSYRFWKPVYTTNPFWYKAADNIKDILWHSVSEIGFSDHFPFIFI